MVQIPDKIIEDSLTGRGSGYVGVSRLQAMLPEIYRQGYYVQSLEVFETLEDGGGRARLDLSILGLEQGFDRRAKHDGNYSRQIVEDKLKKANALETEPQCIFWLDNLCES